MPYRPIFACASVCALAAVACSEPEGPGPCDGCECFSYLNVHVRLPEHPPARFQVLIDGEVVSDDCDPDIVRAGVYPGRADHALNIEFAGYSYFDHERIDLELRGRETCREPWRMLAAYYELETAPDVDRDALFDGIGDDSRDSCHLAEVHLSCIPADDPADVPFASRVCS